MKGLFWKLAPLCHCWAEGSVLYQNSRTKLIRLLVPRAAPFLLVEAALPSLIRPEIVVPPHPALSSTGARRGCPRMAGVGVLAWQQGLQPSLNPTHPCLDFRRSLASLICSLLSQQSLCGAPGWFLVLEGDG